MSKASDGHCSWNIEKSNIFNKVINHFLKDKLLITDIICRLVFVFKE